MANSETFYGLFIGTSLAYYTPGIYGQQLHNITQQHARLSVVIYGPVFPANERAVGVVKWALWLSGTNENNIVQLSAMLCFLVPYLPLSLQATLTTVEKFVGVTICSNLLRQ